MSFFQRVSNVASGRYRHWNENNNQNITDLWYRTEEFPPAMKMVFREFLGLTLSLVDILLNPDQKDKLIQVDPLDLSKRQYSQIHAVLLEALAGTYAKLNPGLADSLLSALTVLTGKNPENSKVLETIFSMDEVDAGTLGSTVWSQLIAITRSPQGISMIDAYPFIAVFGSASAKVYGDIRAKLVALQR